MKIIIDLKRSQFNNNEENHFDDILATLGLTGKELETYKDIDTIKATISKYEYVKEEDNLLEMCDNCGDYKKLDQGLCSDCIRAIN